MASCRNITLLRRDARGAGHVEYMILIGLVALAGIGGFRAFGHAVAGKIVDQGATVASIGGESGVVAAAAPRDHAEAASAIGARSAGEAPSGASAPPLAAGSGIQQAVMRTLDEPSIMLAANEIVGSDAMVPKDVAELEKYLKVMAENHRHVKSVTLDEGTASIQIRLGRMAHMGGYKDASIPLERASLSKAKAIVLRLKGKIDKGEVPTHDDAKQLYDLIRREPLPTGTKA